MSQYVSTGEFKKLFISNTYPNGYVVEDLLQIPDYNEYGFFIESNLEYPGYIKESTQDFPPCPYQV